MDKFIKLLRKISIRRRLAYAFVILCVLPISAMIMISIAIEFISFNNNLKNNYENFAYESDIRINNLFEQVELKFKYLTENNDVLTDLYLYATSPKYQTNEVASRIENTIAGIMSNQGEIANTIVFFTNGSVFSDSKDNNNLECIKEQIRDIAGWHYLTYENKTVLCRSDNVEIDYTSGLEVTFAAVVNIEELDRILANTAGSSKQQIAILDENGRVLAGRQFRDAELYYSVVSPVLESGLRIKSTFVKEAYDRKGLLTTLVLFFIVIAASGTVIYLINESIGIPLNRLLGRMERIHEENVIAPNEEPVNTWAKDEQEILNQVFTSMLKRLNEVLDETYIVEINETELRTRIKELELVALQQRINPHFLYNLLDNIFWIAQMQNYEEIGEMVTALGDFFKTSISEKGAFVSIKTEIENVKSYVYLQKIMHKNQFHETWDIDPDIVGYKTVKLVLQPIIENCIVHGFEGIEEGGIISIRGRKESGTIVFEICDNGKGMEDALCDKIRIKMNNKIYSIGDSIGMRNVNQRIKIYFGEAYGIKITSKIGEGTIVSVCIPIKE